MIITGLVYLFQSVVDYTSCNSCKIDFQILEISFLIKLTLMYTYHVRGATGLTDKYYSIGSKQYLISFFFLNIYIYLFIIITGWYLLIFFI